jgi:HD-GYP domain-containing protein (c-di-GMP phosphodiesterase class II)
VTHIAGLCFTDAPGQPFTHDPWLLLVSYGIASVGLYAGLDMVERMRNATGRAATLWLLGSAATLGGSEWATHFMCLLALTINLPIQFDPGLTVLSLLLAVAMVAAGLQIARAGRLSRRRIAVAGAVFGLGLGAMHYVGMAALLFPGYLGYHLAPWGLSFLIAIPAGIAALWLAMKSNSPSQRLVAALIIAGAICSVHFVGMSATAFIAGVQVIGKAGVAAGPLASAVGGITLALLALAVFAVRADRRLLAANWHEAEALRLANLELLATQREILRRLCIAAEYRDNETGEHVERIGLISRQLALAAGCDPGLAEDLLLAAPLHDVGKIGVPDHILLKPGRLTPHETAEMRKHPEIGYRIMSGSGVRLLDLAAEIARSHHEKWDGSGYPNGLIGEEIPLCSRIVAIADVFDALLSARSYKEPWSVDDVRAHMAAEAGRHFDPVLVRHFLADMPAFIDLRIRHTKQATTRLVPRAPTIIGFERKAGRLSPSA